MKAISVKQMSPAVMSRARNGHTVRLMSGTGTQLIVEDHQYDAINKAFLKNKGVQIALSPPTIQANQVVEGSGIFGKKADKLMKKAGVKKFVYKTGAVLKPLAEEVISNAATAAMMAAPEAAPAIMLAQSAAEQYLNNPKSLQGKKGAKALGKKAIDVGVKMAAPAAAEYGIDLEELKAMMEEGKSTPMSMASMKAKGEEMALSKLQSMVDSRRAPSTDLYSQMDTDGIVGNGMRMKAPKCPTCCGSGLYAGSASGRGLSGMAPARSTSTKHVNLSRKLMGGELQALQSQAADANFAFRYTLPPAYQR